PIPFTFYAVWRDAATLYAYPNGAASSPTTCDVASDLADACTLEQALDLADDYSTVILAADPGTGNEATFTTTTGWEVPQDNLTIQPDTDVVVTLDGQHAAEHLLDFSGDGTLTVTGLNVRNSSGSIDTSLTQPGGGIINRQGSLDVSESTFTGHRIIA